VRLVQLLISIFCLLSSFQVGVCEKPKSEHQIKSLNNDLGNIKDRKSVLHRQLKQKKIEVRKTANEIQKADQAITYYENALEKTAQKLKVDQAEQSKLRTHLHHVERRLEQKKRQLCARLRAMNRQSELKVFSALLRSKNLGDLAARKLIMQKIATKDRQLFDEIISLKKGVQTSKQRKDQLVLEEKRLERDQKDKKRAVAVVKTEKQKYLEGLKHNQRQLLQELNELEAQSNAIAAKIRAYMASVKGTDREQKPYTGGMLRPVPGRVSSEFGYRFHPILRVRKMHTGIDISARSGTPIKCAANGIVLEARWRGGYGNMVLVDHGGGIQTLYAHCSVLIASAGQKVSQGDVIGKVGSTGMSTGPHLHFEVRKNGYPVDPLDFL
jgi:murein DD-endopeptidase MepM/ murein hydrolase activator NlpD